MDLNSIKIKEITLGDHIPYDLLLSADPSIDLINEYIKHSKLFIAELNSVIIATYVLLPIDKMCIEIKNIAVKEKWQGKGIGNLLLNDACQRAKLMGYTVVLIGTADTSLKQLSLYQKSDFVVSSIKKDFFIKNYREPIYENGKRCKDMIILEKKV